MWQSATAVTARASRLRRLLGEFALKGAAVDAEGFGGMGDVSAAFMQHTLDVLPFQAGEAGHVSQRRMRRGGIPTLKRGEHLIGTRRF